MYVFATYVCALPLYPSLYSCLIIIYTGVLICTDLMARGVDFKAVKMVINYDLPLTSVAYIHRIGRTGRGGRTGDAITFFTESDIPHMRSIANVMKLSGCDVPDWLLSVKQVTLALF